MSFAINSEKLYRGTVELLKNEALLQSLPVLPKNIISWIKEARPVVDGKKRNLEHLPFWVDIYNDNHWDVMIVAGRQVFKSTFCTDICAHGVTTEGGVQVAYVVDDDNRLSAFSNQRMRVGTFEQNPKLMKFPRHGTGNVGEISCLNGSTLYMSTHIHGYKRLEGKSPVLAVLDETQYQDVHLVAKLESAFTITHGKLRMLGIGHEAGSPWHQKWMSSDQRQWKYNLADQPMSDTDWRVGQEWRKKLQFNSDGLVVDEYMKDVCNGRWTPLIPDNNILHGYHIPQQMMPQIPLTIEDAVTKYRIPGKFSIEYKEKEYVPSIFITHILGAFYRAHRRPVTREMVLKCMSPYSHMSLMRPDDVIAIKNKYGEKVVIALGIDWGSGPAASSTVVAIMLYWVEPRLYQLAWIEKRPQEDQFDQARYMTELFKSYHCDIGVADLGYGVTNVKTMQDGGYDKRSGNWFDGVGKDKLFGCMSMANTAMPFQFHEEKFDQHGDKVSEIKIDKTTAMDEFIGILEKHAWHPLYRGIKPGVRPQLIIPSKHEYETHWLIEDFLAITRKDLDEVEDAKVEGDPRQRPRKEYNHPRDSVMAIIYAVQASNKFQGSKWHWVSA